MRVIGRWARTSPGRHLPERHQIPGFFGGIIIGLSVFQIEFDFGVPQFRQVFQPMLIAAAGAFGLVAARMMLGRGAAIVAALMAIGCRTGRADGRPGSRRTDQLVRASLGGAVVVELLALTPVFKRPIVFGLVSGFTVSTVGLWLESLWIDAVYHYLWPTSIWPEALMMAVPVACSPARAERCWAWCSPINGCPPARSASGWSC